jgi:LacI family transcriptional regulator
MTDTGKREVTRSDVAKHARVSTAVVSYVVNNGPRPVAKATRERVLASMETLGYRPNAAARALRLQRATAVGLVVPDVSNTYFGALARAVSNRAFDAGYALLLGDSDNDIDREAAQIDSLVGRQVDGLIVISLDPTATMDVGRTPTVYLDRRTAADQAVILPDNYAGARMAVEHLLQHGRQRIGHLAGPEGGPGADERLQGWEDTVRAAGQTDALSFVERAEFTRRGGYEAGRRLLKNPDRAPDGLFVSSDVQALGLLRAAREAGVRVPEDLAVISFDGTEDAAYSDPPLTSIEQPVEEIAATALAAVLTDPFVPVHERVDVRLVTRASCGCHPYA